MKTKKSFSKSLLSGVLAAVLAFGPLAGSSLACTSVLVGKNASADGSVIVARNEDSMTAWTKRFVVHPKTTNPKGAMFKSAGNSFTYPLPAISLKYSATPDWDPSEGQFEENGINELEVAVSGTETIYANDKVKAVDPWVEDTGITECSIPSVLLPRIKTASEGVKLLGEIIEKQGAGEGFGVIIADKNEAWYVESGSGHRWVAAKVPDDSYMVVANHMRIDKVNLEDTKNFAGSSDLITFAKEKGLYDPQKDGEFNFSKVYGTDSDSDYTSNYPRIWWGQKMLTPSLAQDNPKSNNLPLFLKPDNKIALSDVMAVLRSHYDKSEFDTYQLNPKEKFRAINVNTTMESHVIQLRDNLPAPIAGVQWLCLGVPETSVYIPFYEGISTTPSAYILGSDSFDVNSAYWTYRSINTLTSMNYDDFSKIVIPEFRNIEQKAFTQQKYVDEAALKLYNKNPKQCELFLTDYSNELANTALTKAHELQSTLITKGTKIAPHTNIN